MICSAGGRVTMGPHALVRVLWIWPRGHPCGRVTGGGGVTQRLLVRTWFWPCGQVGVGGGGVKQRLLVRT